MNFVLAIVGVVLALVLGLARALALDEIRARIQRRAEASVEVSIASLSPSLQEEWGAELRAELASMSSMPLTASAFARGLRRTVGQLEEAALPAPASSGVAKAGKLRDRAPAKRVRKVAGLLQRRTPTAASLLIITVVTAAGTILSFTAASDPLNRLIIRLVFLAVGAILAIAMPVLWRKHRN